MLIVICIYIVKNSRWQPKEGEKGNKMKYIRYSLITLLLLLFAVNTFAIGPAVAGDVELVVNDPPVMSIRQMYATHTTGAIAQTLSIQTMGTNYIELISIRLHLSGAAGAGNFIATQDSALGIEYDTVFLTQDISAVVDYYKTYQPGEAIFDNNDKLNFAWPNANNVTYGLEVLYRQR